MASSATTRNPVPDLHSDKIAAVRQYIRENAGVYGLDQVDKALQAKYGVSSQAFVAANDADFWRSVGQGASLGHADEIAGLYAKLTGKSYTAARDEVRKNGAEFQAVHPVLKLLTEAVAGALPGIAAAPLAGIQKGATAMNMVRGGLTGLGLGAVAGEGNSSAPTPGGVAKDAALSAGVGGVLGAGGAVLASKLASAGNPFANAAPAERAAATQLPSDPTALMMTQQMMARQQQLAPGTVVLADMSPPMQKFVRVVGADAKTGMVARDGAQTRLNTLLAAKRTVGQSYDVLKGLKAPADQQITDALEGVGRRDLIRGGQVDLGRLHVLRSALDKTARQANAGMRGAELRQSAADITDWLADPAKGNAPWIRQSDADFAFLTDRTKAAQQTLQTITKSSGDYSGNKFVGREPASLGGSISVPVSGGAVSRAGTTIMRAVQPSVGKRAKAAAELLLSPQRNPDALERLMLVHDALLQSQSAPFAGALQAGVSSAGVQGLNSVFQIPTAPLPQAP